MLTSVAQDRDAKYPQDNHLFSFISIRTTSHNVARTNRVSPIREIVTTQQKRSRRKKIRRARADLRNCSARDDEIVPVWTRRDSRQALTAMTYDLEYLTLLTTPSLEQPMLYLGIRSEAIKVKTIIYELRDV